MEVDRPGHGSRTARVFLVEPYEPPPVPPGINEDVRRFLEEELATIALLINHLIQYNEDNP